MSNFKDDIGIYGYVKLNLLDNNNNVIFHMESHNRIVNGGRSFLVRALQDLNSGAKIDAMSAGTYGGPTRDDTVALQGGYNKIALTGSDIIVNDTSANPQIIFEKVLRKSELSSGTADLDLKEVGIYYNTNTLFSRYFFPVLTITNDVSLQVIWTISFLPYSENL